MTTETKEEKIRRVSAKDGIKISPGAKYKPVLLVKKTQFDIKVRLHNKDRRFIQQLYDFITDLGQDLVTKEREFARTNWIILPTHFLRSFKKSGEFDVRMVANERLKWLKGC